MFKKFVLTFLFTFFTVCSVYAEQNYIVECKGGLLRAFSEDEGMEYIGNNTYVTDKETAESMLKNGTAEYIEPDLPLVLFDSEEDENISAFENEHNDTYYSGQIYMQKMNIPAMQAKFPCDIKIAVIDSGVNISHPDLVNAKILPGYNFVDNNTDITDTKNHGTRVASIMVAENDNNIGVAGIVPNAQILPLVALTSSGGQLSDLIQAINAAVNDYDCKIINISAGVEEYSRTLENTVNSAAKKGVVIVCAAGNEGKSTPAYPAYFENTISVGALTNEMELTTYTRRSGNIDTAVPYKSSQLPNAYGSYTSGVGTSFTAPVITAVTAMILSAYPDKDVNDIRDIIKGVTADVCESGRDDSGFGVMMCDDIEKYLNDKHDIYISPVIMGNKLLVKAFQKKSVGSTILISAAFKGNDFIRYEYIDMGFDGDDICYFATTLNDGESAKLFVWDNFESQKNRASSR